MVKPRIDNRKSSPFANWLVIWRYWKPYPKRSKSVLYLWDETGLSGLNTWLQLANWGLKRIEQTVRAAKFSWNSVLPQILTYSNVSQSASCYYNKVAIHPRTGWNVSRKHPWDLACFRHAKARDQREQVRIHSADVGAQDVGAPKNLQVLMRVCWGLVDVSLTYDLP